MSSFSILAIRGTVQGEAIEAFDLAVKEHGHDVHEAKLQRKLELFEFEKGVLACLNAGQMQNVINRDVVKHLGLHGFEVYFCNEEQTWSFTYLLGKEEAFEFNPATGGKVDFEQISTDWDVSEKELAPYFALWPKRRPIIKRFAKKGDEYLRGDWLQGYDVIRAILKIDVDVSLRSGFSKSYEW